MSLGIEGAVNRELPFWLPRFGFCLALDGSMSDVSYYGREERETYADKFHYARTRAYRTDVDGLFEFYEKPQTCGVRTGVRSLSLEGGGSRLSAVGDGFDFSVTRYSDEQMANTAHHCQLRDEGVLYLHLDYKVSGVGSTSCGSNQIPNELKITAGEHIDFDVCIG